MPVAATIDTPIEDAIEQIATDASEARQEVKELRDLVEKLEAKSKRPGAANDNVAFSTKHANDNNNTDLAAEKKALADYLTKGMSVSSDPDGGALAGPQISTEIRKRQTDQNPIRQLAHVVQVGSNDSYQEPQQIGDVSATWVGDTQSRPATTTPTLGTLNVPLNEIYALQPVTQRLLDDANADVAGFVMERVADRFARAEGTAFVNGNGVGQPKGFLSYTPDTANDNARDRNKIQYIVSGSATDVTLDALKKLYWSLRAPFRSNAAWVMSSSTASALDQLKDGQNRPLWRDAVAAGVPPTLLGKYVYFCEDMPSVAGNAFPIALADWSQAYIIADRPQIKWLRDPYSAKPNVLFYAYARVGGGICDSDAIKLLRVST